MLLTLFKLFFHAGLEEITNFGLKAFKSTSSPLCNAKIPVWISLSVYNLWLCEEKGVIFKVASFCTICKFDARMQYLFQNHFARKLAIETFQTYFSWTCQCLKCLSLEVWPRPYFSYVFPTFRECVFAYSILLLFI